MQLRVMTEPQEGATYDDLLGIAQEAERLGFNGFFRSDHFQNISGDPGPGSTDAWITLAGLARETSSIRLGTMVSSATFRLPGPLAIAVATVDAMSGGRVELGLGTGWFDAEHASYGIPFPPIGERFDLLEEQLTVITGLWTTPPGERFSFAGEHVTMRDRPALPKPVQQPRPPIIVGGKGPRRTPRLAARFADEFNVAFSSLDDTAAAIARVREACEATGRDPDTMSYGAAQTLAVGQDEDEVRRRASAIGRNATELRR
ncbi:MAG TPA: LLM class F420-dependent oxidoreductase, partial [Actinomycetes bacterium]|nr:LLM class F420-dependent oxidoreductase [Actinomycetes bacterium]